MKRIVWILAALPLLLLGGCAGYLENMKTEAIRSDNKAANFAAAMAMCQEQSRNAKDATAQIAASVSCGMVAQAHVLTLDAPLQAAPEAQVYGKIADGVTAFGITKAVAGGLSKVVAETGKTTVVTQPQPLVVRPEVVNPVVVSPEVVTVPAP